MSDIYCTLQAKIAALHEAQKKKEIGQKRVKPLQFNYSRLPRLLLIVGHRSLAERESFNFFCKYTDLGKRRVLHNI